MAENSSASVNPQEGEASTVAAPDASAATSGNREEVASKLVERFALWSGVAGLVPVPVVDILAVAGSSYRCCAAFRKSTMCHSPKIAGKRCLPVCGYDDPDHQRHRRGQHAQDRTDRGNARFSFCDAGSFRRRDLRDRQSIYSALCVRRNASRLQSAGLSGVHQVAEGALGFAIQKRRCASVHAWHVGGGD